MGEIKTFKDLLLWRKAHDLVLSIYRSTRNFPGDEKYNLVSQIRRSATSVVSNIVEGFRRKGLKDSLNFYNISDSSLEELKYQILLSYDLNYLSKIEFESMNSICEEVSKMLYSWTKSQRQNHNKFSKK